MFFIFQREPCNHNNGCLHICRNFIFIGKIRVNLNSNPFGYLAANVRCLQLQTFLFLTQFEEKNRATSGSIHLLIKIRTSIADLNINQTIDSMVK
jgi:hypothetical protein